VRTRDTVLIIPAAGAGTRLQSSLPKVLSEVNGRPMIDHLLHRYRDVAQRFVLVVHPSFEIDVKRHVQEVAPSVTVQYANQSEPTGMLDAILLAIDAVKRSAPGRVWITWCDQIGVHPDTVTMLERLSHERAEASVIFPTVRQEPPYIHLDRDGSGRITRVRQRREGDAMPEIGESDMGLFSLSADACFNLLPQFGAGAIAAASTRERNFLPFIPWLAERGHAVVTFGSTNPLEAIGVNTPDDRQRLEAYLRDLEQR
jgi:bifunctional UDP-N-acetylglucosamine pyrophosphorylase / glucosamine-1-phosphate N-acetyltransferase